MIYPSIRIEGAILSPYIVDRLDDAPGQRPRNQRNPLATDYAAAGIARRRATSPTGALLIRERKRRGLSWNMG